VLASYRVEIEQLLRGKRFDFGNGFFGGFDAATYYALIRELKPRHVIEVGGGYSTRIASIAIEQNRIEGTDGMLRCIEPHPEERLNGAITPTNLVKKPVQDIGIEFFSDLEANDILFIDSSHTVKFGSDVCYLFLEVLPALKTGVWIHVHDIFFPTDYPAEWLLERRLALNEQYLVESFLSFNRHFSIRLANRWFCMDHPDEAAALHPSVVEGVGCSSLWCQRIQP